MVDALWNENSMGALICVDFRTGGQHEGRRTNDWQHKHGRAKRTYLRRGQGHSPPLRAPRLCLSQSPSLPVIEDLEVAATAAKPEWQSTGTSVYLCWVCPVPKKKKKRHGWLGKTQDSCAVETEMRLCTCEDFDR